MSEMDNSDCEENHIFLLELAAVVVLAAIRPREEGGGRGGG